VSRKAPAAAAAIGLRSEVPAGSAPLAGLGTFVLPQRKERSRIFLNNGLGRLYGELLLSYEQLRACRGVDWVPVQRA
jgi:hypothetical protein